MAHLEQPSSSCTTEDTCNNNSDDDHNHKIFPFAAIVGQEDLKLCLILCAIDPTIGGVLIRGDKGTAKSTAARGLARLLPPIQVRLRSTTDALDPYNRAPIHHAHDTSSSNSSKDMYKLCPTPFVDLPIGATEDRVLGSLNVAATLKAGGEHVFSPGLLAAANRGILYIDEVNLLPPHLVDVLLDAAAMGVNTIQREGITLKHDAKFMLIGTMNPEEGDLRPQLLDRFGLMVDVQAPRDPRQRCEVVRQRITFERDPTLFQQAWQQSSTLLTQQVVAAQERLTKVILKDELLLLISTICTEMHVDSLRADITLYKTATALAAWEGRLQVAPADIKQAAQWVLPHRKRKKPFESPQSKQQTEEMLEELINNHNNNDNSPPDKSNMDQQEQEQQQPQPQEQNDNREGTGDGSSESAPSSSSNNQDKNTDNDDRNGEGNQMETFKASKPEQIKRIKLAKKQQGQPGTGRRNTVTNSQQNKQGHYVRSVPTDKPQDIALDATLRAAAVNGLDPDTGATIIKPENWRRKVRHATTDTLILFVVDASGSMSARQRMETVKGAVWLFSRMHINSETLWCHAFRG
ncbi:chelatase subunit ChlI [Seminavis robusta]|uniref:magnesium chelatase n=1 Tax=Seminavis robusta TaxID=568900 RepID=A0A9N8HYE9_9STRA|nr:chelatase subunit ChlI [Seminavis robusta]|eukprot:Sro2863_g338870.1 chelatase subunit ChlI (577) ;mRNA; f:8509-10239